MRPLPGHFEDEAVDVGVERAAAGGKFAHRQAGLIVHAEDRRHLLQRPGADQGFRPAKIFLRRLKQDPHPPGSSASRSFSSSAAPSITLV